MAFRQYSARDVQINFFGIPIVPGDYDEGDFLTIEMNTEFHTLRKGAGGGGSASQSLDRSAIATVRLLQTSPGHNQLMTLYTAAVNGGPAVGSFLANATVEGISYIGANTMIENMPSSSWGAEASSREWRLIIDQLETIVIPDVGA